MVDFECGESIWTEINRESKKKFTSLGSPGIPSQWEQFQSNCLDFLILPTPSIPRFKQQHLLDEKLLAKKTISQADQVKGKEPLINCSFFFSPYSIPKFKKQHLLDEKLDEKHWHILKQHSNHSSLIKSREICLCVSIMFTFF